MYGSFPVFAVNFTATMRPSLQRVPSKTEPNDPSPNFLPMAYFQQMWSIKTELFLFVYCLIKTFLIKCSSGNIFVIPVFVLLKIHLSHYYLSEIQKKPYSGNGIIMISFIHISLTFRKSMCVCVIFYVRA